MSFSALEWAIMQTVAYADIFNYPVTASEIRHYLIGQAATPQAIETALVPLTRQKLTYKDGFYALQGRDANIANRRNRAEATRDYWPVARHYGQLIGGLPFVRMVAITGSLAANNIGPGGDIDYLIVTEPGRLWLARLVIVGLVRLAARDGYTLCPNYIVSENALAFPERNLFTARELVQMVPVTGLETYYEMRRQNTWTDAYFPNAAANPPPDYLPSTVALSRRSMRLLEGVLRSPPGNWLDRWEMQRKIRKFKRDNDDSTEADFTPDWCKGHFEGHMQRIMTAFHNRLSYLRETSLMPKTTPKILLGQSYYLRFDPKLWEAMQPYPPLGTLYAASYLRRRDYDVALFDAMLAESESEWAAKLDAEKPDYAVIYEDNFNYLSKMCLTRMREAALTMIEMARKRGCTVIVCGSDATDHPEAYLAQGAHYVIAGEGEETLGELLDTLTGRSDLPVDAILGVGSSHNPRPTRRPVMKNLDDLPMPAWDLVDIERYKRIWYERHGYYSMNMVTTRGCPYHCNWCAKPIWGQRYNVHSPERVAREMKHLHECYGVDHIWFADDIMGLKPGWIERFAAALEREGVKLPFKCLSRVDLLLRGNTIQALEQAGCDIVWVGAESGSQKILDAMEKGTRVEDIQKAADRLRETGVRVGFFLQFGYPGETRADIEKTLQLVRDCQPDDIGMSVSYPLPGTSFHERVKDQLVERAHWQDSADLAMLYAGPFTTDFYRKLHTVIHKEFRSRKTWQTITRLLNRPGTFQRRYLRDTAAMIYHRASLPLARRQLNRLAQQPHQGIGGLQPGMDYVAAATPSPQGDD